MSAKKIKKFGDIKIPAQSLSPFDKDGYLTKQGGSIKTWNKRYFILKDKTLYYYKTNKDLVITGRVDLEPTSLVKEEPGRKKPNLFSVQISKRIFFMYPDRPEEVKEWIDAISKAIEKVKQTGAATPPPANPSTYNSSSSSDFSGSNNNPSSASSASQQPQSTSQPAKQPQQPIVAGADMGPRLRLSLAKGVVSFLKDEESKVLEFWQIWNESVPGREELPPGLSIDFFVSTSADMQKLTWRTNGPQNIFIQKMVDFFWNVGAPESEIDRLNDVGALINPIKIGSWIDMSGKGGMDGGWFFPVDISMKLAIEAADAGDAIKKFTEWAEAHDIQNAYSVGRDMGAAPPRQTEIRFKLPGSSFEDQLRIAQDGFSAFNFPPITDEALTIIKKAHPSEALCMSVITSSEGFVRLGLLIPKPATDAVLSLCTLGGGHHEEMASFEAAIGTDGPMFAEYQYLMKGFGYGVYKEGFDIVFHYNVGSEFAQ